MRSVPVLRGVAVLLLAACNPGAIACTEIGCVGGLQVRFQTPPAGAFRVEAIAEGAAAPAVFECGAGETCRVAFFEDLVAERVTVRVITAAGTHTEEFSPRYASQYSNGRHCGAACSQDTVTVQM